MYGNWTIHHLSYISITHQAILFFFFTAKVKQSVKALGPLVFRCR